MIRLRPFKEQDAEAVLSWFTQERAFWLWSGAQFPHYPITEKELNAYYRQYDQKDRDYFFPMTAFDEDGVAGQFTVRFVDKENEVVRFGFIVVDKEKRGKGYGREMLTLALTYAFTVLRAKKVTLGVFEQNQAAWGCYRSLGFTDQNPEKTETLSLMGEKWVCRDLEITPKRFFARLQEPKENRKQEKKDVIF